MRMKRKLKCINENLILTGMYNKIEYIPFKPIDCESIILQDSFTDNTTLNCYIYSEKHKSTIKLSAQIDTSRITLDFIAP